MIYCSDICYAHTRTKQIGKQRDRGVAHALRMRRVGGQRRVNQKGGEGAEGGRVVEGRRALALT